MTVATTRLGLIKPTGSDRYDSATEAGNAEKLDAAPGVHIAISTDILSWSAGQVGRLRYDTDTKLLWVWGGEAFDRVAPKGYLGGSEVTGDFTTSATADPEIAVQVAVDYPPGSRPVQVSVAWGKAEADDGALELSLWRDETQLQTWEVTGLYDPGNVIEPYQRGGGGSVVLLDDPFVPGPYTYSLRARVATGLGNNAYLRASESAPIQITVVEI